ncbi:MAG: hypothetical protein M3Y54_04390 [Bacteroidota bacterium]|nr:hypothetical protein [Bacteroidota bacterium]
MPNAVPVAAAPSIDLRFAQLIQQFGLTKNSFAVSLGKTASVVQHLIDGRNKPGFDLLCRVFEIYPNVSRDWLLLGQGPMLVGSSNPGARPEPVAVTTTPEPPLDPIDLSDVEPRPVRRASIGLAGSRLNPAEIAATLALATAAAEPESGPTTHVSNGAHRSIFDDAGNEWEQPGLDENITVSKPVAGDSSATSIPMTTPVPSRAATFSAATAPPAAEETPAQTPAAPAQAAPNHAALAGPSAIAQPGPEVYLTAALNAQQLQHQLALAELRNQHLLEQQQMLREMLAMARQAMV